MARGESDIPKLCCAAWDNFSKKQSKISAFFGPKSHVSVTQVVTKEESPPRGQKKSKNASSDRPKKIQKTLASFCKPKTPEAEPVAVVDKDSRSQELGVIQALEEEPFPCLPADPKTKNAWKSLMKPPDVPLCDHKEPTKEFTVNKAGPNKGRLFYLCTRPVGPKSVDGTGKKVLNEFRCDFFQWKKGNKAK